MGKEAGSWGETIKKWAIPAGIIAGLVGLVAIAAA